MVEICGQYKNGHCQVLNVIGKKHKVILNGYKGTTCPEMENRRLCGWYPVEKSEE